jgi:transposase-like protein
LAFTSFPKAVWRQIWSNNPIERLKTLAQTRRLIEPATPEVVDMAA